MQIQSLFKRNRNAQVVICFKFSNFAYANTVKAGDIIIYKELLFALNLVTLLMQIQFSVRCNPLAFRCYLL